MTSFRITSLSRLVAICLGISATIWAVSYLMPWASHPMAPLTLSGYDLAELLRLHPDAQLTTPVLLWPALLRIQFSLAGILFLIALRNHKSDIVIGYWMILGILTILQLPPLTFFQSLGDPNYQQQFAISSVFLVAGFSILYFRSNWLVVPVLIMGTVSIIAISGQPMQSLAGYTNGFVLGYGIYLALAGLAGGILVVASHLIRFLR